MAISFEEARREQMKLRMAFLAVSGAGKTRAALEVATNLFDGGLKVFGIDSERGRMKLYADRYRFQHGELRDDFSPEAYIRAIDVAEGQGAEAIIVDSISHEWMGKGGVLQLADRFASWKDVRPRHTAFVDRLLACEAHVIVCIRSKMKYEVREEPRPTGSGTRQVIEKLGLGPVQDDAIIYEFDIVGDIDLATHEATFSNRCDPLVGQTMIVDAHVAEIITKWLSEGDPPVLPEAADEQEVERLRALLAENGIAEDVIEQGFARARARLGGVLTPEYVRKTTEEQEQIRDDRKKAADGDGEGGGEPKQETLGG